MIIIMSGFARRRWKFSIIGVRCIYNLPVEQPEEKFPGLSRKPSTHKPINNSHYHSPEQTFEKNLK
jgi:hypothetical protein